MESTLADALTKAGTEISGDTPYPNALLELGKAFKRMSETRDTMEDNVKIGFLDPLQEDQDKELKGLWDFPTNEICKFQNKIKNIRG